MKILEFDDATLETFPLPQEGILLIRFKNPITREDRLKTAEHFAMLLEENHDSNLTIIIEKDDVSISALSEADMALHGWYKHH